jgi:hypothetical protein
MSIEQFTVQPISFATTIIPIILIAIGAIMIAAFFSKKVLHALVTYSLKARPSENRFLYLILGIVIISIGTAIFVTSSIPSTITVGPQYISYQSSFLGAGSMTINADQISNAYVGQLGQGDLKLSARTFGTSDGNVNIGLFLLSNGKTAHVLTCSQTCLAIELKNGEYVILGTSDTNALATSFSQNVYQLTVR